MTKILSVFGTRPEAIKIVPILEALKQFPDDFESIVCVTAQHRELLDEVLNFFNIHPDIDLNVMTPNQELSQLTAKIIEQVTAVIQSVKPDCVLVQGDTTTCFGAALAAYYAHVPLAHVEAGLRTYQKYSPFPEEMNRRLVDAMADYLYAPTALARENLLHEGIGDQKILVTGNTIVDALQQLLGGSDSGSGEDNTVHQPLLLVTVHRRESFGKGIQSICEAVATLAHRYPQLKMVWPLHPNPNIQTEVLRRLKGLDNIQILEPLGYIDFIQVLNQATAVLTDSGGVQEEAVSLGIPLFVARECTERQELLKASLGVLTGTDAESIVQKLSEFFSSNQERLPPSTLFGDGRAAVRIVEHLKKVLL